MISHLSLIQDLKLLQEEAQKRGYDCQLLERKRLSRVPVFYLKIFNSKKTFWISPQRGYFNSKTACDLSLFKYLTFKALALKNLPIPKFARIKNLEDLEEEIKEIPGPWVLKPVAESSGKNVLVNIKDVQDVKKFASRLLKKYPSLMIEEFIEGKNFRLLVLDNQMLAASHRAKIKIVGDGKRKIKEIIEKINHQRLKLIKKNLNLDLLPIKIDFELKRVLNQQRFCLEDILPAKQEIILRYNANVCTGSLPIDVTEKVHPENKKIAIEAVAALGLHLAGVDIMTRDISQSILENGGKIIEINNRPALSVHHSPVQGKSQNVVGKIIDYLFGQ